MHATSFARMALNEPSEHKGCTGVGHNHYQDSEHMGLAFSLNLGFSFIELVGGFVTGSFAILADAIHDFGDAATIGIAWMMEKSLSRSQMIIIAMAMRGIHY